MAAQSGSKDDKVVGVSRSQRQVIDLRVANSPPDVHLRRVQHQRAALTSIAVTDRTHRKLGVDHRLLACVKRYTQMALRLESGLLDFHRIGSQRQIGNDIVAFRIAGLGSRKPCVFVLYRHLKRPEPAHRPDRSRDPVCCH
jgi:hypothetical protein